MEFVGIIIFFIVAGGIGTAIMIWAISKGRAKSAEIEAVARANGWGFEDRSSGYVKSDVIFAEDWTLSVSFRNDHADSGTTKRWVEFHAPTPAIAPGSLCILGPELPEKTVRMAAGGGIMAAVTKSFVRGMGSDLRGADFVASTGGDPNGTVLATPGAEHALDAVKGAPLLIEARKGRNEMLQPVVFIDENGFRVRVRSGLKKAEDVAMLVRLGLDLRARAERGRGGG